MAYSSVRVQFEIGHEASIRTKYTPEGFTHDWEVFVRGADNTDIQCFVEKVVFYLHETFPRPKRAIKEPPYVVKESGYAGFVLPIDVYLKNKEEPKKISFQYDLTLQPSGPPISRVLREPRLFQNPSEDFRRKLIRGGGVGVDSPSEAPSDDLKSGGSKAKLTDSSVKKHKTELPQNDSFRELFGIPIRRVDPKKLPELPKKLTETESPKDKKSSKHGSYKNEKEIFKEKTKHLEKEKVKERDKSKEKPPKRPASPPPPPIPQVVKPKEEHKKHEEKEKKKEEHEEKRKRKEEKEKKEKPKELVKEVEKPIEKEHKKEKKELKDVDYLKKLNSIKPVEFKTNDDKNNIEVIEKERPEKEKHKHRHKKKEKEKNREKEKHKKGKDKSDKESREREKEKDKSGKKKHEEIREKEEKIKRKSRTPSRSPVQERPRKGPLNALLDELGSSGSGSPLSEEEDPIPTFKPSAKPPPKIVPEVKSQPAAKINSKLKSTNLNAPVESRVDKEPEKPLKVLDEVSVDKVKKDKSSSKKNKKSDKDLEKKRTKETHRERSLSTEREEEDSEKDRVTIKEDRDLSGKETTEEERPKSKKDKENRKGKRDKNEENHMKAKKTTTLENNGPVQPPVDLSNGPPEPQRVDKFTKEYIAQLKDLQHRIMALEDGEDLQNIVKVIAETGQYEITKKTFDFDLCALDLETVKRLQDFFNHT